MRAACVSISNTDPYKMPASTTLLIALFAALTTATRLPVAALRSPALAIRRAAVVMEAEGKEEEEEDRLGAGGRGGHSVTNQPEISDEEKKMQAAVMEHQQTAARLTNAEEAKSLVGYSNGYAVLSTLSKQLDGYPSGSVVGFAPDEQGLPVFCFSAMSGHTQDLLTAPKGAPAALTVTANGFEGAADARVTLIGDVKRCSKEEAEPLKELYKKTHDKAFWVDFGDFTFFRMSELKAVRFIGGFARAGDVAASDYLEASIDPIMAFAKPVMGHMNSDHGESTVAMVEHYIGIDQVEKADLVALDQLGFTTQVTRNGQTFKLRLPFPRPAADRKDVKTLIVEMTQASMSAAASE